MSVSDPCPVEGCDGRATVPAVVAGGTQLMCRPCATEAMAQRMDADELERVTLAAERGR